MNVENKLLKIHEINLLKYKTCSKDSLFHENIYDPQGPTPQLVSHEFIHVALVVEGCGIHRIFDQSIPCKAGDIYIVPPNTPHGFFLAEEGVGMAVDQLLFDAEDWFKGEISDVRNTRFCYGIFNDNASVAYALLNEQIQKELNSMLVGMECELIERRQEWQEAVRSLLTQFLITVGRYINCAIKNDTHVSTKDWNVVMSVMRMAKEHYSDSSFTLESVAESLYISRSHLSRIFKGLTGQFFSEYLRDIRINNACNMLLETKLNVDKIAECCGLRDVPSFYRNFSTRMNMTPSQYRQIKNAEKKENTKKYLSIDIVNEISENLQKGKAKIVKELVQKALDQGVSAKQILNEGLLRGMEIIGEKFKNNEIYVPEVLVSARAMNIGVQILKAHLAEPDGSVTGRVCIGTVQGDLHDIGKNLVKMMMEGKGLEVIDLGTNVAPDTFITTAMEKKCQVICCSALLTTTRNVMADVVKAAERAGVRNQVKIMIGGAPVTQEFCNQIGADCYTADAASAADAAVVFCQEFYQK